MANLGRRLFVVTRVGMTERLVPGGVWEILQQVAPTPCRHVGSVTGRDRLGEGPYVVLT
jgi:hypothetical protein